MSAPVATSVCRVALIGNPNTGKSTLFGALVGIHQHVANYPGVTVEKKTGRLDCDGRRYELIDLPGLYSLAPRSRDEMVAADVLLGRRDSAPAADVVLCIVDASNLHRNLYLIGQVLELGLPTVVAVNMVDVAERRGIQLDLDALARRLGVVVVPVQANRQVGVEQVKRAVGAAIATGAQPRESPFPAPFEAEVAALHAALTAASAATSGLPIALARRLLLDADGYLQQAWLAGEHSALTGELAAARRRLAAQGCPVPDIETSARYEWVRQMLDGVVRQPARHTETATDRIDHWLTHRVWGTVVFVLVMAAMFQAVFVWAEPLMDGLGGCATALGGLVESHLAEGPLRSLLVDGVIGGVGSVLRFLPQIAILFLFIALLEDCGYMARAAFLMDRLMARVGLSGRSFIPMLSCFACSVPGIMATRVIEDERDRLTTILVAPLLTCSARLPVYALLIAAFVPAESYCYGIVRLQGLTLTALYLLGIVAAVLVALVLKRTLLRGQTPPLLLELPSYKWPSPRTIAYRVLQRAWIFVRTAGTLILAISMLVWAALYYPHNAATVAPLKQQHDQLAASLPTLADDSPQRAAAAEQLARLRREMTAEYQRHSLLGRLGRAIEPAVRPLGWDWRIGCAVLASFPAREVVVATMGVMFNQGDADTDDGPEHVAQLAEKLKTVTWDGEQRPLFNLPVALSLMVFFALCAQCAATLAVMRRETNSWRWPAFAFTYMTVLAYVAALVTYQVGTWLGG